MRAAGEAEAPGAVEYRAYLEGYGGPCFAGPEQDVDVLVAAARALGLEDARRRRFCSPPSQMDAWALVCRAYLGARETGRVVWTMEAVPAPRESLVRFASQLGRADHLMRHNRSLVELTLLLRSLGADF